MMVSQGTCIGIFLEAKLLVDWFSRYFRLALSTNEFFTCRISVNVD